MTDFRRHAATSDKHRMRVKGLESNTERFFGHRSSLKARFDEKVDPVLWYVGSNAAALMGMVHLDNHVLTEHYTGPEAVKYGAAAAGLGLLNKFAIKPIAEWLKKRGSKENTPDKATFASTMGTLAKAGIIAGSLYGLSPNEGPLAKPQGPVYTAPEYETVVLDPSKDEEKRLEELASHNNPPCINAEQATKKAGEFSKESEQGRLIRTARYQDHTLKAEKKYGVPQGLCGATFMHESYGNPAQLNVQKNGGSDGGAGLAQMQPGTAQELGFKTYGESKVAGRDTEHGKSLQTLVANAKNLEELVEVDDRFNPEKAAEMCAKYLRNLHDRFAKDKYSEEKNWDRAVVSYHLGSPSPSKKLKKKTRSALRKASKERLADIKGYQDMYNEKICANK